MNFFEKKTKQLENINSIDFAVYKNKNVFKKYTQKTLKILIIITFLPLIFIFYLSTIKEVSKIFKQVLVILYLVFFIVFIYTLFSQDKIITSNSETVRELKYISKIRSYE